MNFCQKTTLKENGSDNDIPKSARIVCIIQLCLAFTVLLWVFGTPFTDELYRNKKTTAAIEWLTIENSEYYETLSPDKKSDLQHIYEKAHNGIQESFLQKLAKSFEELLLQTPITKQLWLLLAFILPFLVMKQIEGSREVFWVFPILALLYAWQVGPQKNLHTLYPTESYLEQHYLSAPITGSITEQKEQLEKAWQSYIAAEWSKAEKNSSPNEKFANGLYHFIYETTILEWSQPPIKPGILTLGSYVIWNLLAAFVVNRRKVQGK